MPASTVYRDVNEGRTVIQEQEEISRNHVQTFIYLSVPFSLKSTVFPLLRPVKHLLWLLCVLVYYERSREKRAAQAGKGVARPFLRSLPPSLSDEKRKPHFALFSTRARRCRRGRKRTQCMCEWPLSICTIFSFYARGRLSELRRGDRQIFAFQPADSLQRPHPHTGER